MCALFGPFWAPVWADGGCSLSLARLRARASAGVRERELHHFSAHAGLPKMCATVRSRGPRGRVASETGLAGRSVPSRPGISAMWVADPSTPSPGSSKRGNKRSARKDIFSSIYPLSLEIQLSMPSWGVLRRATRKLGTAARNPVYRRDSSLTISGSKRQGSFPRRSEKKRERERERERRERC